MEILQKSKIANLKMTVLEAPKELEPLVGLFEELYVCTFDSATFSRPWPAFRENTQSRIDCILISNELTNAENHRTRTKNAVDWEGLGIFCQLGMLFG